MAEARNIAGLIKNRNGKSFIIFDKRNVQFYLYDRNGRLLRIGPAAIGKGKTEVGAFETPVGVFPIKSKVPVDDWVRPGLVFQRRGRAHPTDDTKTGGSRVFSATNSCLKVHATSIMLKPQAAG